MSFIFFFWRLGLGGSILVSIILFYFIFVFLLSASSTCSFTHITIYLSSFTSLDITVYNNCSHCCPNLLAVDKNTENFCINFGLSDIFIWTEQRIIFATCVTDIPNCTDGFVNWHNFHPYVNHKQLAILLQDYVRPSSKCEVIISEVEARTAPYFSPDCLFILLSGWFSPWGTYQMWGILIIWMACVYFSSLEANIPVVHTAFQL